MDENEILLSDLVHFFTVIAVREFRLVLTFESLFYRALEKHKISLRDL